jgi:hypothetical protein
MAAREACKLPQTNEVQVSGEARSLSGLVSPVYTSVARLIVLLPRDVGGREWHIERSESH